MRADRILVACTLAPLFLTFCSTRPFSDVGERAETVLILACADAPATRSQAPDEELVSDINLFIYNGEDVLEERRYLSARTLERLGGDLCIRTSLLTESPYFIYAAANLGYALPELERDELLSYRFFMAYPDEYSRGIPMTASLEGAVTHGAQQLCLSLERCMARVDLCLDRSALDAGIRFDVVSVSVGGCPSSVILFGSSKAETDRDIFSRGFFLDKRQAAPLNRDAGGGVSQPVSLYLLENRQGDLLDNVVTESGKVFTEGRYAALCSYIELRAEYFSERWHTAPGRSLAYRFYLGESPENFDVCRNARYRVTVRPQGTGLDEDSWRVDKEGIEPGTRFELHPAAYNECRSGEDFHLWCDVLPEDTPMEIEPLSWDDDDIVHGLYAYDVDPDGHGLILHTLRGGSAFVYFKAGPPVNRDTLALVVIDP